MFQSNVLLKSYSNYDIGGPARYFFEAKNLDDIIFALDKWRMRNPSLKNTGYGHGFFILAGGTNLLFDDKGFSGLVLKPNIRYIDEENEILKIGAGVPIEKLLEYTIEQCLSGLEWAGGLPGTLGGAVYGNAGAFGGEMKDVVREVVSLDLQGKRPLIIRRTKDECGFGYRTSIFKKNPGKEIIIEATLQFMNRPKNKIRSAIEEKILYRKERQPLEYPNIGSIFKNVSLEQIYGENTRNYADAVKAKQAHVHGWLVPVKVDPFPVIPAAFLISEAGLKGVSYGGAMISPKHPNFIINALGARASDVKSLIQLAKDKVKKAFKIGLEEEIEYVL